MVPSFEKRVRAFSIDTSGVALFSILSIPLGIYWAPLPYVVVLTAFFGFNVLPHLLTPGQTLGKRTQKIKIVNLDGGDLSKLHVILRDLFKVVISIVTVGVYLIVAHFAMNEYTGRTIHDYLFKTKVIDLEEKPQKKYEYMNRTESMRKRGL